LRRNHQGFDHCLPSHTVKSVYEIAAKPARIEATGRAYLAVLGVDSGMCGRQQSCYSPGSQGISVELQARPFTMQQESYEPFHVVGKVIRSCNLIAY